MLAHAFTYLQSELSKPSNTKYPKLKEYLTTLFEATCNYSLLLLSESEALLKGSSFTKPADVFGDALFHISLQEGFPDSFMQHMNGQIEDDFYKASIQAFYTSLLREASKVGCSFILNSKLSAGIQASC
jgi:hypothetical protein